MKAPPRLDTKNSLSLQNAPANPWPHRLAWALALCVFPLIWMGGTVTTYDAGMAVPDWPTTYSYWFYPVKLWLAVWDVFLEHGHRLLAQLAGLLAIALATALWRLDNRKWMRWVGVAVVAGVIVQGALGGWRVLSDDRLLARIHGCTAPLYLCLCAAVIAWTSRAWRDRSAPDRQPADRPLLRLAWLLTALIYLEIVLGAQLRRPSADAGFGGATLPPWLQTLLLGQVATWFELWVWLKVINAGLIAMGVVWLVVRVLQRAGSAPMVVRRARWLALIVFAQLALAVATWVTNYGWPAWFTHWIWPLHSAIFAQGRLLVLLTTAHAAIGSLVLVASLSLTLWLLQMPIAPGLAMSPSNRDDRSRLDRRHFVLDYLRLLRPWIVAMVLLAMAVAAWMTADLPPSWSELIPSLLGTALVVAGAIALNERLEWQGDAKMQRTADRPLPAGRLSRRQVTVFGLALTVLGLVFLALATSPTLTLLAAVGWFMYVAIYTPLKTRSAWQTPLGALAGAMPVLLGAAAVGRSLSPWALLLFGIVFFWQFPHSMAIAWRFRREFAAAGVKLAAVTDPTGQSAGRWAMAGAATLLPISLTPLWLFSAGATYGLAAGLLGVAYLGLSVCFARRPDDATAHRLLLASLIYLPALFVVLLLAGR
jgi:protoheme IX farnesyltransferase